MQTTHWIGIDIGCAKTAVILGELEGGELRVASRVAFPTEAPERTLARIFGLIPPMLDACGGEASAIGISCAGAVDRQHGVILASSELPGWAGISITGILEERYGIPASLQNEANAAALAEVRWGAAKGCNNAVYLTFGEGMRAGLVLSGQLYEGASGLAGSAGHMRLAEDGPEGAGKAGSFEGFCSGGGITALARSLAAEALAGGGMVPFCVGPEDLERIDAPLLAQYARLGDPLARDIFRASGRFLGRGLAVLTDLLNPEIIVIGGIFAQCHDLLWPDAEAVLRSESLSEAADACRIEPSALEEAIGDYAALAVALS